MITLRLRCFTALTAADDETLRRLLLIARLDAFLLTPWAHHVTTAACTATVWVINRVHDFTTHLRALAQPARLSSFTMRYELVLGVTNFADGRETVAVDLTNFGRRHTQRDVVTFLGNDFS